MLMPRPDHIATSQRSKARVSGGEDVIDNPRLRDSDGVAFTVGIDFWAWVDKRHRR
jgi:hypothetical protein